MERKRIDLKKQVRICHLRRMWSAPLGPQSRIRIGILRIAIPPSPSKLRSMKPRSGMPAPKSLRGQGMTKRPGPLHAPRNITLCGGEQPLRSRTRAARCDAPIARQILLLIVDIGDEPRAAMRIGTPSTGSGIFLRIPPASAAPFVGP